MFGSNLLPLFVAARSKNCHDSIFVASCGQTRGNENLIIKHKEFKQILPVYIKFTTGNIMSYKVVVNFSLHKQIL